MKFFWTKQRIDWFIDASEYTGFHRNLAQEIFPEIHPDDSIVDFGCGIGLLDLALAERAKKICGMDISEEAITQMNCEIANKNLKNVTALHKDATQFDGYCDVGIMSFFGKSSEDMGFYRKKCHKKLIRIANIKNDSTLYPKQYRKTCKDTAEDVKQELLEHDLPSSFKSIELEFGQPLRSEAEVFSFIHFNAPKITNGEMELFLKEKVVHTNDKKFPFYIPNKKPIGIFTIY